MGITLVWYEQKLNSPHKIQCRLPVPNSIGICLVEMMLKNGDEQTDMTS